MRSLLFRMKDIDCHVNAQSEKIKPIATQSIAKIAYTSVRFFFLGCPIYFETVRRIFNFWFRAMDTAVYDHNNYLITHYFSTHRLSFVLSQSYNI